MMNIETATCKGPLLALRKGFLCFALAVLMFGLSSRSSLGQVQCLVAEIHENGRATFENVCDVDIVMEFRIGNPDFSEYACFSSQTEIFPCQFSVLAGEKANIEIPIGPLDGGYRACYLEDLGSAVCEFQERD